jgi:DNA-binding transcriptional LysR family regulator
MLRNDRSPIVVSNRLIPFSDRRAEGFFMKLHYLKYFCVLAEELHFHRAADRLAISQPPLSAAIKGLEEELGVQLLRRNSKLVELTPAGSAFLVEAREILERVDRASNRARAFDEGIVGQLEIGLSGSLLYREVPKILAAFRRELPTVEVVLRELSTAEQIDRLMRRQLDAGFLQGTQVPPPLASMALQDDEFTLCLPERHALAERTTVDLRDFAHDRFIMFTRDAAPSNHDNVIALFSSVGIHPRTVHSVRTWMTMIAMVSQVDGVALVPRSLARAKIDGVRFVRLRGVPSAAPALLSWNPGLVSKELARFLDCAGRDLQPREAPAAAKTTRARGSGRAAKQ